MTFDVDATRLRSDRFVDFVRRRPRSVVHFLLNVGDGDAQLVLLPSVDGRARRAVIVDIADQRKLDLLIADLRAERLLADQDEETFPVLVATHPHRDHIAGVADFLKLHPDEVGEVWEPGFLGTIPEYYEMMVALEAFAIARRRPTAGFVAVVDDVRLMVLSPSLRLRQQFMSHGVHVNNASIALRLEWPAGRVEQVGSQRRLIEPDQVRALLLGADAQSAAWSHVLVDYPDVAAGGPVDRRAVRALLDRDVLPASLFKVPHHGSKRGLHFELIERVRPALSVISAAERRFPDSLTMAALRSGHRQRPHQSDDDVGIHSTGGRDTDGEALGTIATVIGFGARHELWRFGDTPASPVNLSHARRYV